MSTVVRLTDEEMAAGAFEGVRRNLRCMARNAQPHYGGAKTPPKICPTCGKESPEPWKCDIEGALAEVAVHRLINRSWSGINQNGADVGVNTGVRHCPRADAHLIINDKDPDERKMVLVTGTPPVLTVHGWFLAGEAKIPKYHREGRPKNEFWVPQSDLHELPVAVATAGGMQ